MSKFRYEALMSWDAPRSEILASCREYVNCHDLKVICEDCAKTFILGRGHECRYAQ